MPCPFPFSQAALRPRVKETDRCQKSYSEVCAAAGWRQVQSKQPCSAHVPQDLTTRAFSAFRARCTRTDALVCVSPCCSANVLTGVPATSISAKAWAYSGLRSAARLDTQAQIRRGVREDGPSLADGHDRRARLRPQVRLRQRPLR